MKAMPRKLIIPGLIALSYFYQGAIGQDIDSIAFHLYTDSLKKGVHNYINVDGYLREGRWMPLTSKDISMTSSGGKFERNNLVIDPQFSEEKVIITATYNRNKNLTATATIYLKKVNENEIPAKSIELSQRPSGEKKTRRKKKGIF